jgi:Bifunctional DNA primase/polymerase, N-terminal
MNIKPNPRSGDCPHQDCQSASDLDAGLTLTSSPRGDAGSDAYATATWALEVGLWPVAIRPGTKRPIDNAWGAERSTAEKLEQRYRETPTAGVGLCLGPDRGPGGRWLVDLEMDGPNGEASLSAFVGVELVDTLGWSSNRGPHRLFSADGDRLLKALAAAGAKEGKGHKSGVYHLAALPDLEIRVVGYKPDGTTVKQIQSVCPPTPGIDGKPREWNGCWTISELPEAAYAFVERITAEPLGPSSNGPAQPCRDPRVFSSGRRRAAKYARAAMEKAVVAVAAASDGTRHDVLRRESLATAGLVKAGVLTEDEYRAALMSADQMNGHADDDPGDAQKLIDSALQMAGPRDLSFLNRPEPKQGSGKSRVRRSTHEWDDDDASVVPSHVPSDSVPASFTGDARYIVNKGHLQFVKHGTLGGVVDLANFDARILECISRHDGSKELTRYRICATHAKGHQREIVVESDKFAAMTWIYDAGPEFTLGTGRDTKDRVRQAIQLFSQIKGIASRVEHTSLGWIRHEGQWLYLHAGGAIGASGASDAVSVDVSEALSNYRLPHPPIDQAGILQGVEAHLTIWDLAKSDRSGGQAAAAILATLPFRAVLSAFDGSVHFGGPSANRKTSVARIVYQHFSTTAHGRNFPMPAGWGDTANALQRLLFDCRDCPLIIDDLKQDWQANTAEVIVQAQGNLQNRARMNIDQSLQKALNPRGSLLSTGEIDPRSRSTLGRMLMVEIRAGDIDVRVLTQIQALGDQGLLATVMAAYVQWLAPQLDAIRQEHERLVAEIQLEIGDFPTAHARHPNIIAQLVAAYQIFLRFAVERDAIAPISAEGYLANAKKISVELGQAQGELQEDSKPGRRFLVLIASALQSHRWHLRNALSDNSPREYAGACGWHKDFLYQGNETGQMLDWRTPINSKCIGFIDEEKNLVYLDPVESVALANEMGKRHNDPQSFKGVARELLNEGLCQPHNEGVRIRPTKVTRIRDHGVKRYLWIPIECLFGEPEA